MGALAKLFGRRGLVPRTTGSSSLSRCVRNDEIRMSFVFFVFFLFFFFVGVLTNGAPYHNGTFWNLKRQITGSIYHFPFAMSLPDVVALVVSKNSEQNAICRFRHKTKRQSIL